MIIVMEENKAGKEVRKRGDRPAQALLCSTAPMSLRVEASDFSLAGKAEPSVHVHLPSSILPLTHTSPGLPCCLSLDHSKHILTEGTAHAAPLPGTLGPETSFLRPLLCCHLLVRPSLTILIFPWGRPHLSNVPWGQ